jgi:hypothetical protein
MHRLFLVGILLLAGCHSNNTVGPFEHRNPEQRGDPLLTPADPKPRGHANLALPEDSPTTGLPSDTESEGTYGR